MDTDLNTSKKLELTLCGMLPYGLRMYVESNDKAVKGSWDLTRSNLSFAFNKNYKPILHSIDKLTEPILEGGLIPIDYFEITDDSDSYHFEFDSGNVKLIRTLKDIAKNNVGFDVRFLPFVVVEKLKEWHFNIYDLPKEMYIEKSETL